MTTTPDTTSLFTFAGERYWLGDIVRVTRHTEITIEGPIIAADRNVLWLGEGSIYNEKAQPIAVEYITKITLIKRKVQLPTVPGLYVSASMLETLHTARVFKLTPRGLWTDSRGYTLDKVAVRGLERVHEKHGLVALTVAVEPEPKPVNLEARKNGVFVYYDYGLDIDGQLSSFPNLILKTDGKLFSIPNTGFGLQQTSLAEVKRTARSLTRLTLEK